MKHARYIALALVLAASGKAYAGTDVSLTIDTRSADEKKGTPPDIVARVNSNNAPPTADKLFLVETDPDDKKAADEIAMPATEITPYTSTDDALGIVVVFETHHLWLGNDSWWTGLEASKTPGVFKQLTGALDQFNAAGPNGSKGALVGYGNGAETKWLGDLKELSGEKIGTQQSLTAVDQNGKLVQNVGLDVTAGIDEAINDLKTKMGPLDRKVIVLIGDGNNADSLADYKKQVANEGITVYAIFLQEPNGFMPGDPNGWKKLTANVKLLDSPDNLKSAIGNVVSQIPDHYYVRFPGADIKAKKAYDYDNKAHSFALRGLDPKNDIEVAQALTMPLWKAPWLQPAKGTPWWVYLLGAIGVIGLIAILVKVFTRKPAPAPAPVVMAPPPVAAPAAPAPAPAGPMKTMMVNLNGDDGWPVVGWIVPLNGANQFQTFKLSHSQNKIGTGGNSHIVINDGFMSTEHCTIVVSPNGFTLVDGGSMNGTLVNERKVDKHELVDNDSITMGKTTFRFKSIN